jgi:hypothetical protein
VKEAALFSIVLFFVFICLGFSQTVFAQVQIGVGEGDSFKYNLVWFYSNYVGFQYQQTNTNYNGTITYRITRVAYPNVNFSYVWVFQNGSINEYSGSINIETGDSQGNFGNFFMIVGKDLKIGAKCFPSGPASLAITNTITENYAGIAREANIAVNEYNMSSQQRESYTYTLDKKTGVLTNLRFVETYSTVPFEDCQRLTMKLQETDIWIIPEFPSTLTILFFAAIASLAALLFRRKRNGVGI